MQQGVVMPDARGWPDPANPGRPPNPHQAGPHLIMDEYGKRWWAWWTPENGGPAGGWMYATGGGAGLDWTYIGPAVPPDGKPVP
jgi:hypothetical protein